MANIIPYFHGQGVSISEPYMQVVEALNLIGDAINNGIGGGRYLSQTVINFGLMGPTASPGSVILWNSTTPGLKSQPLPKSTGSLNLYTISDVTGSIDEDNAIVPQPISGLAIVGLNPGIYSPYGSITLLDTILGYIYI